MVVGLYRSVQDTGKRVYIGGAREDDYSPQNDLTSDDRFGPDQLETDSSPDETHGEESSWRQFQD